jgi:hypothetical protein
MAIEREWTDDRGSLLRIDTGPPPADAIRLLCFVNEARGWEDQNPKAWAYTLLRRLADLLDESEAEAEP